MRILILLFLFLIFAYSEARDPYDDDLKGKNLICSNKSLNIEDWGVKFSSDKNVVLFSLNKALYEIYQYKRKYRTDVRNIYILKNKDIEHTINRNRLMLGNKKCKIVYGDPVIFLQQRIKELKNQKRETNKI